MLNFAVNIVILIFLLLVMRRINKNKKIVTIIKNDINKLKDSENDEFIEEIQKVINKYGDE